MAVLPSWEGSLGKKETIPEILAEQNLHRTFWHNIVSAGQNRPKSKSTQKKMNYLCCIRH